MRLDEPEFEALLYEFKAAINEYLATLDPTQVKRQDARRPDRVQQRACGPGAGHFRPGDLRDGRGARAAERRRRTRRPLATLTRAADTQGLAHLLRSQGVEVLLAPSNGPAELIDQVWGDRRGGGWSQIAGAARDRGLSQPHGARRAWSAACPSASPWSRIATRMVCCCKWRVPTSAPSGACPAPPHGLTRSLNASTPAPGVSPVPCRPPRRAPPPRAPPTTPCSATPATVAWGYYSGLAKPVLTVHSGDTVRHADALDLRVARNA